MHSSINRSELKVRKDEGERCNSINPPPHRLHFSVMIITRKKTRTKPRWSPNRNCRAILSCVALKYFIREIIFFFSVRPTNPRIWNTSFVKISAKKCKYRKRCGCILLRVCINMLIAMIVTSDWRRNITASHHLIKRNHLEFVYSSS